MKKILLTLVVAVTGMVAMAQNFTVTGTVLDNNGNPVNNHTVWIVSADSAVFPYSNNVTTDILGNYSDIIPNGAQIGPNITFEVSTYDYCTPNGGWQTATLSNNQGTTTSGIADFTICDSAQSVSCYAYFYSYGTNPGTYQFIDYSSGVNLQYAWDFGDGNTSTQMYPVHSYSSFGTYTVCLTITGANSCNTTYCSTVNYTSSPCQASYVVVNIDSTTNTIDLVENSTTSNVASTSYFWDFGDGNTSTSQWPSHTYGSAGIYYVCLTISDSLNCTSTYCDSIGVSQFMVDGSRSGVTINVHPPLAVSVEEMNSISELKLFPNPANENVTINYNSVTAGNHQISITDISGKLISTENFDAQKGSNQKQFSLSEINAGIYLVSITDENGNAQHLRLIKE